MHGWIVAYVASCLTISYACRGDGIKDLWTAALEERDRSEQERKGQNLSHPWSLAYSLDPTFNPRLPHYLHNGVFNTDIHTRGQS